MQKNRKIKTLSHITNVKVLNTGTKKSRIKQIIIRQKYKTNNSFDNSTTNLYTLLTQIY